MYSLNLWTMGVSNFSDLEIEIESVNSKPD